MFSGLKGYGLAVAFINIPGGGCGRCHEDAFCKQYSYCACYRVPFNLGEKAKVFHDMKTWPRDARGRLLCDFSHPMPEHRDQIGQQWVHLQAAETDHDSDYSIEYKCKACGHKWSVEMPD